MTDHRPRLLPLICALLALAATGSFALPPAESRQDAAEETAEAPSAEDTEVYKNFLRWSTASEEDNFGYDVYRGESEEGPFERVTEKPILGAGTTDEPTYYEFVDDDLDPYATYWYFVESISMTSRRDRFSPIVRKAPKLERPAPEDGGEKAADEPGR